ncbi:MAG: phage shock protein operon transcriptional activator [Parahaliea sp.]
MRTSDNIIGNSANLIRALDHISALAPINRPILILGERGTGKELAAERLHYLSPRWQAPLLKVNCAAMAESLLESELFGHEAGAFTGASRSHLGHFERADGGTLFLDELGTMSLRLQEKLLRLVEYGEFERVGGQQTLQVDVRVAAATNADLRSLAEAGRFRLDLLDRLSFDVVHLPPLRRRHEDIRLLAEHFAMGMCAELGWAFFAGFSETALASLHNYGWPGNIRELKNTVERSLHRWADPDRPVDEIVIDPFTLPWTEADTGAAADDPETVLLSDNTQNTAKLNFNHHMQAIERQQLEQALAAHSHNQRRTAETLGLSYNQIRALVRKHHLGGKNRPRLHPVALAADADEAQQ